MPPALADEDEVRDSITSLRIPLSFDDEESLAESESPANLHPRQDEFALVPDHRELTGDQFATADLVGIVGSGLMHLKTRIFETPSDRFVLSGSLNPGDNAVLNEETLHLIRTPDIVERYVGAYDAVLHRRGFNNVWDPGAAVNVLFTPASRDRAVGHVFDWLAEEDEQILLMVFSLRDITAPGHVLPCCHSPFTTRDYDGLILGNAFQASLAEIWNGDLYRQFRAALQTDTPWESCDRCGVIWSL